MWIGVVGTFVTGRTHHLRRPEHRHADPRRPPRRAVELAPGHRGDGRRRDRWLLDCRRACCHAINFYEDREHAHAYLAGAAGVIGQVFDQAESVVAADLVFGPLLGR